MLVVSLFEGTESASGMSLSKWLHFSGWSMLVVGYQLFWVQHWPLNVEMTHPLVTAWVQWQECECLWVSDPVIPLVGDVGPLAAFL